jgi:dipeptide/tripeptide permease
MENSEAISASVVTLAPVLVMTGLSFITVYSTTEMKGIGLLLIIIGMGAGLIREKIKPEGITKK